VAAAVVDVSEDLGYDEHTHAHIDAEDGGVCRCHPLKGAAVVCASACEGCWDRQVVPLLACSEFLTTYVVDYAAWVFARNNATEFCATLAKDGNPTDTIGVGRMWTSSESWIAAIGKMPPADREQIKVLYVHTGYWCSREVAHVQIGNEDARAQFLSDVARALPAAERVYLVLD